MSKESVQAKLQDAIYDIMLAEDVFYMQDDGSELEDEVYDLCYQVASGAVNRVEEAVESYDKQ